ncbi:B-box zinc finger protein [Vigna angularis]|uniref:B-box zinc finger protein n=1 Tax=Phaseolus angularis TaxID=3914 RepID=A0A8T0L4T0_PHAAN|nr:B-box zinc finger protein [Vigna angularis]
MKIQCNVCEATEAKVLFYADEAALCWECDEKVNAANKLASKHQRVPLSTSSSHMPKCDICQVYVGIAIAVVTDEKRLDVHELGVARGGVTDVANTVG